MPIIAGTQQIRPAIVAEECPVAVDLGFSSNRATCGLHCQSIDGVFGQVPGRRTFGQVRDCILAAIGNPDVLNLVIILEAPLSGAFSEDGNPQIRTNIEQDPNRPWYVQPGLGLGFAAFLLIRQLAEALAARPRLEVIIFEGFVSGEFVAPNGSGRRTHRRDAQNLLQAFVNLGHHLIAPAHAEPLLPSLLAGVPEVVKLDQTYPYECI